LKQARHKGRLQRILHLVLDAHHHQVTRYLHHRHSDGSAEQQGRNGHDLAGIARGDNLREYQLGHVWGKHRQQHNAQTCHQRVQQVILAKAIRSIAQERLDSQMVFRQWQTGNQSLLLQQVAMPTRCHRLAGLRMDESIVRKAGLKDDGCIVVGHEPHHVARAASPPAVAQRDVSEEDVVALQQRLHLFYVLRQFHGILHLLP